MTKIRLIILLFLTVWCCQQPSLGVPQAAQQYFDKATTLYLVGDLDNALKTIDRALNINHNFSGAIRLKKSIIREMKLRQAGLIAAATKITTTTRPVTPATTRPASRTETKLPEPPPLSNLFLLAGFLLGIFLVVFSAAALAIYAKVVFAKKETARVSQAETAAVTAPAETAPLKILQEISFDQAIWYQKFGWRSNPFTLDVHPELLSGYETEVKEILGKINSQSGHILVAGPLGIGKTTILRWLAANIWPSTSRGRRWSSTSWSRIFFKAWATLLTRRKKKAIFTI